MGQFLGENPTEWLAFGKRLRFLALLYELFSVVALCRFDTYSCTIQCRARPVVPRVHSIPQEPLILKNATLCVVLFYVSEDNLRARIRRILRLCTLRAPLCPGHTARSLRNASISASLLTSPVVPTNKKAHQDDVLFLLYGTIFGREPENLFSAFGGCLQPLALCTVFNLADTVRRFAVYP